MIQGRYIAAGGVVIGIAYLFLSNPDGVVVSPGGQVQGFLNKARVGFQGDSFWRQQQALTRSEIQKLRDGPERIRQLERELNEVLGETDSFLEKHGGGATPAQRKAEALRARADAIEQYEIDHWLEQNRRSQIRHLEKVDRAISATLK